MKFSIFIILLSLIILIKIIIKVYKYNVFANSYKKICTPDTPKYYYKTLPVGTKIKYIAPSIEFPYLYIVINLEITDKEYDSNFIKNYCALLPKYNKLKGCGGKRKYYTKKEIKNNYGLEYITNLWY